MGRLPLQNPRDLAVPLDLAMPSLKVELYLNAIMFASKDFDLLSAAVLQHPLKDWNEVLAPKCKIQIQRYVLFDMLYCGQHT